MERGIKFRCFWQKTGPLPRVKALNALRQRLYARGLIFAARGVGHGNASVRMGRRAFLITGAGTGRIRKLNRKHFSVVTRVDIAQNAVWCRGPIKASSESMTHHAIYQAAPSAKCVIHVHAPAAWKRWVRKLPTTGRKARYGTPELAREVAKLFRKGKVRKTKAFVLGGHKPGMMAFGRTVREAEATILRYVR